MPEIVALTKRPKTSIYFHIKNIPLTAERLQAYRRASGERIRHFALSRKGKSIRSFRRFDTWSPERARLLGHLMFDGEITRNVCTYNNRSLVLIEGVERLMRSLYTYPPRRYINSETGVIRTAYFNVELGLYLRSKAEELLRNVTTMDKQTKREFLRAFFDDEGCMDFRGVKRRIRGYQKEKVVLHVIRDLLSDFGIVAKVVNPNEVVISGKSNLVAFQREINFSIGVRINGKRSNSIWKRSLEKREILDLAIRSFKT